MLIPVSLCNVCLSSIIFLALTFAVSEIDVITPVLLLLLFLISVSLLLNTLCTYIFLVIRKFKFSISLCVCVSQSLSCVRLFVTLWTVCSPPGSSVRGILQARMLEWIPIPFSGDLPDPGIEPWSSASQADSLPFELQGSANLFNTFL